MLNNIYRLFRIMASIFALFPQPANSQTILKEFCDSIPLAKNMTVIINSKKSNLVITRWEKSMIRVKVDIAFTHMDPSIARQELTYARYNFIRTASGANINNYFSLPKDTERIKSIININYSINIPDGINLIINNEYGNCQISGLLQAFINLNNKYGDIRLDMVSGKIRVFSTLCDIHVNDLSGKAEFDASNSNFNLRNINGDIAIANKVGNLHIECGSNLDHLKINSSHSGIDLTLKNINHFNYNLYVKNAIIEMGHGFNDFPFSQKSVNTAIYQSDKNTRSIEILNSNNPIKIH